MEIRAGDPVEGAYVDTSIPKVAETPLEGSDASATKTFGPFESDPAAVTKTPNSKGYTVRFQEKPKADVFEKAIDSIIMFIDDVREASSSPRGDGTEGGGCMNAMSEALDATHTFDCVREPRNPCADPCSESFGKMQPPVDMMLTVEEALGPVEEEKREEYELKEATLEAAAPPVAEKPAPAESADPFELAVLANDNSENVDKENLAEEVDRERAVKTHPPKEARASAVDPGAMMPTYTPVETIADKFSVPQDTIQMVMDAFVQKNGDVRPDAADLAIKKGVDSDPVVEFIDNLILFFDDLQEALATQRGNMVAMGAPNQASSNQQEDDINKIEASEGGTEETERDDIVLQGDLGGSDNTTMSEDTMKTTNTNKVIEMAEAEYLEAVASAEALMATPIVAGAKHEESHKQALERIMSEGSGDETLNYKTDAALKLEDLIKEADQAIMDARSRSTDERDNGPTEELVILGHSATLTPIPEADEASAGTPSSDMIEEGVVNGTIPEVPLLPAAPTEQEPKSEANENQEELQAPIVAPPTPVTTECAKAEPDSAGEVSASPPAKVVEGQADLSANQEPQQDNQEALQLDMKVVDEEVDPIVYCIDRLFLFYDDMQEPKSCEGCLGAAVPSDLVDQSDEIVVKEEKKGRGEDVVKAKIEPRLNEFETPEDSRGQLMLQEALKLVQQATIDGEGEEADDLVDRLAVTFDEAERAVLMPDAPNSKLVDIEKKIITAHGIQLEDTEQNREIAKLVEAAFAEKGKLRSAWNAAVGNPSTPASKGKEQDPAMMTPQMSLDVDNEKQTKVEFVIPELMKHNEDPCMAWGGDDSELMASINADRKLSEMEHEHIFRDVSNGLQESSAGIITGADNQDVFSIYNAPAFTEGNSSSAELPDDRLENPARAALKVLCAESGESEGSDMKGQQTADSNDATTKARDMIKQFAGWSLSKKREEMLRTKQTGQP